ncbi:MAG: DUF1585 domain-containing protein [Polyangiaceae bacterium]
MPSGEKFDGADEMAQIIASDPRFTRCLTKQVMTYALGRGVDEKDEPFLSQIETALPESGGTLHALMALVAQSEAFRTRRGEPVSGEGGEP